MEMVVTVMGGCGNGGLGHLVAHYCAEQGCSVVLPRGTQRCPTHTREPWRGQHQTPRIRGRKLQRLRNQLFDKQPLCVWCLEEGKTAIAVIRDHIIPLAEGGPDTQANSQPLCQECSDVKTKLEQQRGKARTR